MHSGRGGRADRARIARIAHTPLQASHRVQRPSLTRLRDRHPDLPRELDNSRSRCQSQEEPLGVDSERAPRTGRLYALPHEAAIRRNLRGRPACPCFCPCTRCHAQGRYNRTKRARRDQRADRVQPLERERERGGVFTASMTAFYNCSDRRRRRRSRPSAPRRCTPRSRRTSTSARRAPRRSRTTSPSSRASSAAPTLMRVLLTRRRTPPWPRPPLRRAGPDAASQKETAHATPPSLR